MRFTWTAFFMIAVVFILSTTAPTRAELLIYTDETSYLTDLAGLGYTTVHEGFESEAAWGSVRTTIGGGTHSAPSINNLDLTWTPNNPSSGVTTSSGAARTGSWGFYQTPHGDPLGGIGDGFVVTGDGTLFAFGGWFRTNTPPAKIDFLLDGTVPVEWAERLLIGGYDFYGIIETAGFTMVEVRELEWGPGDLKYVFADDFRFTPPLAASVPPADAVSPLRIVSSPNPFRGSTGIRTSLPDTGPFALRVYDATGRLVRALISGARGGGGSRVAVWDGRDESGVVVSPGVYYVRLEGDGLIATSTLVRQP